MRPFIHGILLISLLLLTTYGIVAIAEGQLRIPFDGLRLVYYSETTQVVQERVGIHASFWTTLLFHNVTDTSSAMNIDVNGTVTQNNQQQPQKYNETVNFPTDRDTLLFLRNGGQNNLTIYAGPSGVAIPALPGLTIDLTRQWDLHDKPVTRTPLGAFSSYRYHTTIKSLPLPTGGTLDLDFYAAYEMNTQVLIEGEVWATINGSSAMIELTEIRAANLPSNQGQTQCLIATASYGSELAPQVQFLRELRDERILRTFAGSSFMLAFNTWYYSFSPSVANAIRTNSASQIVMQVLLSPLLLILRLSAAVFDVISFQPEFGVFLAGLAASGMIGVFYLSTPTFLLYNRYRGMKRLVRFLLASLGAGIVGLILAEVLASSMLATVSSATIVLSNLLLCSWMPSIIHDKIRLQGNIRR